MVRVFTNGPRDRGSILDQVLSKTQKWYLKPPYWQSTFLGADQG